ncbi:MAG: cbb3-type cytochrome oxidase subunit 3 [Thermoanaerobaculales bacterium]
MSLSDIMSAAGLSSWAELALILCFITFSAIVVWVFVVRKKLSYEHLRGLPLEDDNAPITKGGSLS